jgi:hypothetical protein
MIILAAYWHEMLPQWNWLRAFREFDREVAVEWWRDLPSSIKKRLKRKYCFENEGQKWKRDGQLQLLMASQNDNNIKSKNAQTDVVSPPTDNNKNTFE